MNEKCSSICFTLTLSQLLTETPPTKQLPSPSPKRLLSFNLQIPLEFTPWQSSRNVAERERNCWKAKCLKQKINKSLLWFEWVSPDAGHQTKLHLLLQLLQPPPLLTTTPAYVQRNSPNGWSVSCKCSSKTSHRLSHWDLQQQNFFHIRSNLRSNLMRTEILTNKESS